MAAKVKFTADQVYAVVSGHKLTEEQQAAVQDAPIDSPTLVVAGAGSGKTELMSVRVLWLVANGFAKPQEILGLTFTRKAAAELSKRIYESLLKMRDTALWPENLEYDFSPPTISTYNAYSNGLFRDFALAIGYEPEAALLTEAGAFQLAREVVIRTGADVDSRLTDLDINLNPIIEAVLALAQELNDNIVGAAQVEDFIAGVIDRIGDLPKKAGSSDFTQFAYMADILKPLMPAPTIARLAEAYINAKGVKVMSITAIKLHLPNEPFVRCLPSVNANGQLSLRCSWMNTRTLHTCKRDCSRTSSLAARSSQWAIQINRSMVGEGQALRI